MSILEQKYKIISTNQQSTFFRATTIKDNKQVAIKRISFAHMSDKDKKLVTEEVNILRNIKSANIVKYYDYLLQKSTASLYIVMEYCSDESLQDFLQMNKKKNTYIDQNVIWKIFSQIIVAVSQIHNDPKGAIIHRDIKPKNILLSNDKIVKLGNFSLLRRLNPQQQFSKTYIPTTYYRSPQQILSGIYSTESDIWAMGCLLYQIASLKSPFKKQSEYLTAQAIKQQKIEQIPSIYSPQLRRIINWCLDKKRQNRPTAVMLRSIPQINYRIRKNRITENKKQYQQKQKQILKRQENLRKLQQRISELQALQYLQDDKQNSFSLQNILRESGRGSKIQQIKF